MFSVSGEVPRVDHVHVVKVGGRRLVGEIYHVVKRQIPDRECFVFRVTDLMSAFVFLIKLGKAGRHFSRTRTGRGYYHEIFRRFDKVVLSVTIFADDERNVVRVALYRIMPISFYAERGEFCFKSLRRIVFLGELSENYASHVKSVTLENVYEP